MVDLSQIGSMPDLERLAIPNPLERSTVSFFLFWNMQLGECQSFLANDNPSIQLGPCWERKTLKDVELRLVSELMKNSRRSDRELSRVLGISQPTVGRLIKKLEKKGILQGYSAVLDMAGLGVELIAVTFANWSEPQQAEAARSEIGREFLKKHPNIICASTGRGMGFDRITISLHKDYSEYVSFVKKLRENWGQIMTISESFIISCASDNILRPLSLQHIGDYLTKKTLE
jgi:DNA-binding Lrp family transcriptional regulator